METEGLVSNAEFQPVLNGGIIAQQSSAWSNKVSIRIKWDYNGKILKVQKGIITYILAVPTIIWSELETLETLVANNTLAYDWYKNLSANYSWTEFNEKGEWWSLNLVNTENLVIFEWKTTKLTSNDEEWQLERKKLVENIKLAYENTKLANKWEISRLISVDTTNNAEVEKYANAIISNDISRISLTQISNKTPTLISSTCNGTNHWETKEFWSKSSVWFAE